MTVAQSVRFDQVMRDNAHCGINLSRRSVDIAFLRTLAGSSLPRRVPAGPAFQLVLTYHDVGYVVAEFPLPRRTRYGYTAQPDAVVLAVTVSGLAAIKASAQSTT
jgi:hypothetical protein